MPPKPDAPMHARHGIRTLSLFVGSNSSLLGLANSVGATQRIEFRGEEAPRL
jgi:hypothetical protein